MEEKFRLENVWKAFSFSTFRHCELSTQICLPKLFPLSLAVGCSQEMLGLWNAIPTFLDVSSASLFRCTMGEAIFVTIISGSSFFPSKFDISLIKARL